jgi:AcrR family transcriptional regulator
MPVAQSQIQQDSKPSARQQLIVAAERLFAEAGIDAVSLRQINVAAKQKNSSAAHYHFGSKEALILAIYSNRMVSVNMRRQKSLDQLEAAGHTQDIRGLVKTIVLPIVQETDADESGQNYIRFMAQAMGHPQLDLMALRQQEHGDGLARALGLLRKQLPHVPDPLFGQRFGLCFEQIVHSLADRERLRSDSKNSFAINSALFVGNLVDCVSGAMAAPVSEETFNALKKPRD